MNLNISHLFLATGSDGLTARSHVLRFLDQTTLVKYDRIQIVEEHIISAEKKKFWPDLEASILENRRVIVGLKFHAFLLPAIAGDEFIYY